MASEEGQGTNSGKDGGKRAGFWKKSENLPKFSDDAQRRAFQNILRFFAVFIVLTLIARGTSSATLAVVSVTGVQRAEITDAVGGAANVVQRNLIDITVPSGLTVKEVFIAVGQYVKAGEAVAGFDVDLLRELLTRENAALDKQLLQLEKLVRVQTADSFSLTSAEAVYENAKADYDAVKASSAASVASAKKALTKAKEERDRALEHCKELEAESAPEAEIEAAYAVLHIAEGAVKEAEAALAAAEKKADADNKASETKLKDAETSLERARKSYEEALQQTSDANNQNRIEATTLRLDIEKQRAVVEALKALLDDEGILYTGIAGTVAKTLAAGQKTDSGIAGSLYGESDGFYAQMRLKSADAEKLAVGDVCEVTTGGGNLYYRPTVSGTISEIGEADDSGGVTVVISLPSGDWKNGQSVQAQVVRSKNTYNMCLPVSAIRSDQNGYYVLVVTQSKTVLGIENIVRYVPVTLLAADGSYAAVDGAIARDTLIITRTSKAVEVGDRVRVDGA